MPHAVRRIRNEFHRIDAQSVPFQRSLTHTELLCSLVQWLREVLSEDFFCENDCRQVLGDSVYILQSRDDLCLLSHAKVSPDNLIDLSCAVNVHPQDTFAAVVGKWRFFSLVIRLMVPVCLNAPPTVSRRLQLVQLETDYRQGSENCPPGSGKTLLHGPMPIKIIHWFGASRPLTWPARHERARCANVSLYTGTFPECSKRSQMRFRTSSAQ